MIPYEKTTRNCPDRVTLTVPSAVNPGPVPVQSAHRPTAPLFRLPMVAWIGEKPIICDNQRLPFRSGSMQSATCFDVFEYVVDDQQLMAEVARILAPGARVEITVPNRRGLGMLDGLNAYRYVRDTTGHGAPAPVLAEVGWRRHYAPDELEAMMKEAGLREVALQTVGAGIGEVGVLAAALSDRLATPSTAPGQLASSGKSGKSPGRFSLPSNLGARIVATAIRKG